ARRQCFSIASLIGRLISAIRGRGAVISLRPGTSFSFVSSSAAPFLFFLLQISIGLRSRFRRSRLASFFSIRSPNILLTQRTSFWVSPSGLRRSRLGSRKQEGWNCRRSSLPLESFVG